MLQSIRDRTHGWIAGIIISLLILSFALWGIHSYLGGGESVNNAVVKVNGVEITKGQLANAYDRLRRQLQSQSSESYELPPHAEALLKDQALQALINFQVLKQASLVQNYFISQSQVDNYLVEMPEFQVNGQFSVPRFQQILGATSLSANEFLDLIRTSLLIDQPRLGMIFTSFTLPNEVNEAIALVNQKRDIQFMTVPLQSMIKETLVIPQDKIVAYYQQHQNEFKTPEQVSIAYIELSIKDLINKIHPTDEELQIFYNENSNLFSTSFNMAKDKVKEALAHQKAEEQFAMLREKLANVTYEHPDSLGPAAKELGLTIQTSDLFIKDKGGKDISSNSKIREAAFTNDVLNLKENSDVIQTASDSAVVVRIRSHLPASLLALKTVQSQILDKLKANEIDNKTGQFANEIKTKLQAGADQEQLAQQFHLVWNKVGFIERHSTKVNSAILDALFSMPKPTLQGKILYAITKLPDGYAVIGLKAVQNGNLKDKEEYRVFAEQIQNVEGLLEYELYKQSLMKHAKIVTET